MSFYNIILIAFSLAMDSFAVALSNGLLISEIKLKNGIKVGLFFGFFQFIMNVIGYFFGNFFGKPFFAFNYWVCFIFLVLIGSKMVIESFKNDNNIRDENNILSIKNLTILGIATSIDSLAVGISFSILKVNILFSSLLIGIIAFLLSFLGIIAGKKIGSKFSKNAEKIGGIILIIIGIKIIIEYLFF